MKGNVVKMQQAELSPLDPLCFRWVGLINNDYH